MSDEYDGSERRGWHLNKSINIGNIITVILLFFSVVMYVNTIEKRVTLIENATTLRRDVDDRADKYLKDTIDSLRADVILLSAKVDRMYETFFTARK